MSSFDDFYKLQFFPHCNTVEEMKADIKQHRAAQLLVRERKDQHNAKIIDSVQILNKLGFLCGYYSPEKHDFSKYPGFTLVPVKVSRGETQAREYASKIPLGAYKNKYVEFRVDFEAERNKGYEVNPRVGTLDENLSCEVKLWKVAGGIRWVDDSMGGSYWNNGSMTNSQELLVFNDYTHECINFPGISAHVIWQE